MDNLRTYTVRDTTRDPDSESRGGKSDTPTRFTKGEKRGSELETLDS